MARGMSNRNAGKFPVIEKVLAESCLVITGIYAMSELTFSLSILSVTLLALVALFKETLS
jgi:hypothetical protein